MVLVSDDSGIVAALAVGLAYADAVIGFVVDDLDLSSAGAAAGQLNSVPVLVLSLKGVVEVEHGFDRAELSVGGFTDLTGHDIEMPACCTPRNADVIEFELRFIHVRKVLYCGFDVTF